MMNHSLTRDALRAVLDAADRALELDSRERNEFVERCRATNPALADALQTLLDNAAAATRLDAGAAAFAEPLFAELFSEPQIAPASRIGPYRIISQIGRGGMGAVYLAERADDQYRKKVAVKLLPALSADHEHRVRRFLEERQILAALEHPNIARLLDGGITPDGLPWFAMEYVDGAAIDRYCDERCLTIERRLELFCRVCSAVQYAHSNLVVHRDLKPANILVSADGGVKLLDFGIAKLLDAEAGTSSALTRTGERVLTPLYASPEQISGDPISTSTDVYALGVLLHRLLSGRDPYRLPSHESYEVWQAILEREPERASLSVGRAEGDGHAAQIAQARGTTTARLQRRLAGDLDVIVLTALQKDPTRRYRSVEQLEADVRRHLACMPIAAQRDGRFYRAGKFVRRHKAGVTAGVVFALVVAGFTVLTGVQAVRIRAESNRVAVERDYAEAMMKFMNGAFQTSFARDTLVPTAREVLDTGWVRIGTAMLGQPAARAQLMYYMGRAYQRLGITDRAQDLLGKALAIRRTLHPIGPREIDETLHALGDALLDRGDVGGADSAYSEALLLRRRLLDATNRDIARTLNGLAAVRRRQGRAREAEALAREALAIDRRGKDDNRANVAQSLRSVGQVLADRGDDVQAQPLYREALSLFLEVNPNAADVPATEFDLAASLKRSGDNSHADSLIQDARARYQRLVATIALTREQVWLPWSKAPAKSAGNAVAPFESKIVFVSDRDRPDPLGNLGRPEIYSMNPDGSEQRRLTNSATMKGYPVLSPDGRKLAFQARVDGGTDIFVMDVGGTGALRLTNMTGERLGARQAAWSPDGNKIAFATHVRPDIFVVNVDGSGLKNLTNRKGLDAEPAWSPDGQRIAFTSIRHGRGEIYVMNSDGTHVKQLTKNAKAELGVGPRLRPAWSPDGRTIAFASQRDGKHSIYSINADGTGLKRLTVSPTADQDPAWSPDGRQIVFGRRVWGHVQIFVMNADGSEPRRLTDLSTLSFNAFPSWGRAAP